jgi:hypothetical protein
MRGRSAGGGSTRDDHHGGPPILRGTGTGQQGAAGTNHGS